MSVLSGRRETRIPTQDPGSERRTALNAPAGRGSRRQPSRAAPFTAAGRDLTGRSGVDTGPPGALRRSLVSGPDADRVPFPGPWRSESLHCRAARRLHPSQQFLHDLDLEIRELVDADRQGSAPNPRRVRMAVQDRATE